MTYKKFNKNRKKWKVFLLLVVILLLILMLLLFNSSNRYSHEHEYDKDNVGQGYIVGGGSISDGRLPAQQPQPLVLISKRQNGVVVPEKYNPHEIKSRIALEKIENLKKQQQYEVPLEEQTSSLDTITTAVHIFYTMPVPWYKSKKSNLPVKELLGEQSMESTVAKSVRILNIAFYPERGLYKPTIKLMSEHLESIRKCGVGVLIVSFPKDPTQDTALIAQLMDLAPRYNLSVTFEMSVMNNQSVEFFREQLFHIKRFSRKEGFYKVHAQSRGTTIPVIYVSNAYKLSETLGRFLCTKHVESLRHTLDAYFIGHIRLKNHVENLRRLCFDGFYNRLPSNGATFATSWKNWSYLKSFAVTYKMLFVPTVGPGFAERNKFPRHGDIQRHRSNGRYYGVAWRSAILNHVGFINIASFNSWTDGSQIEEVRPKPGYLDYSPSAKTKYLDLTTHWVGNFLKSRQEALIGHLNCYELLNNTIC